MRFIYIITALLFTSTLSAQEAPAPAQAARRIITDVKINPVYFENWNADIKGDHLGDLDRLAIILKQNPTYKVEVSGHTDNIGTLSANMELGEKRASSVKAQLVKKGIAADRIIVVSHGPTKPIADNKTDAGRRKNKRAEIVVFVEER